METNRRSFLGGALALFAATALPATSFASAPVIYGDGIHDDWAGLQALIDGKPFRVAHDSTALALRRGGTARIANGNFRISRGLHLADNVTIINSHFEATPGFSDIAMVKTDDARSLENMRGCYLEMADSHLGPGYHGFFVGTA